MSVWREAVRAELLRFQARTDRDTVTRQELLRQSLDDLRSRFPGSETPERTLKKALQQLRDRGEIEFPGDDQYEIVDLATPFERGETYTRSRLHDAYGGMRQSGIAPSADYPFVFLFYGTTGAEYGYEDEFRGDTFVYTGEGQVGDMEFTRGNRVVRDHAADGRRLYLFENIGGGEVVFVGEYAYDDHFWQELPDANGEDRDAIRFELVPAGRPPQRGEPPQFDRADLGELYERAVSSGSEGDSTRTTTTTSYARSERVREFIRAYADGVCEGCGEEAPFMDPEGEPYLEVHHLYRRADGGADDPANVVALCPNCHRRRHHGADGDEFNEELISYAERRPF